MKDISPFYQYYTQGCAHDAEHVLFIPGVNTGAWFFESALPYFLPKYKVILFNNPGIISAPMFFPLNITKIAQKVLEVLEELHVSKTHIIAHSMGGYTAQNLTLMAPECVQNLVLVSTSYGQPQTTVDMKNFVKTVGKDFWTFSKEIQKNPQKTLKLLFSHHFIVNHKSEYEAFVALRQKHWPGKKISSAHLFCGGAFSNYKKAHTIQQRTLVVHGEEDVLVTPEAGTLLARQIPNARLWLFPNSGHFPFLERKDVYPRLLDFIAGDDVGEVTEKDKPPLDFKDVINNSAAAMKDLFKNL